jgi:hypothetical protein
MSDWVQIASSTVAIQHLVASLSRSDWRGWSKRYRICWGIWKGSLRKSWYRCVTSEWDWLMICGTCEVSLVPWTMWFPFLHIFWAKDRIPRTRKETHVNGFGCIFGSYTVSYKDLQLRLCHYPWSMISTSFPIGEEEWISVEDPDQKFPCIIHRWHMQWQKGKLGHVGRSPLNHYNRGILGSFYSIYYFSNLFDWVHTWS